jgi:hypothetical protein
MLHHCFDKSMDQEPLRTLPGLGGLRMMGQWTAPYTGVVMAALTGRQAIHLMCREDGREFVTDTENEKMPAVSDASDNPFRPVPRTEPETLQGVA